MILIEDENVIETRYGSDHITIKVVRFENVEHFDRYPYRTKAEKLDIWSNFIIDFLSQRFIEKHNFSTEEKKEMSKYIRDNLINKLK